jgi:hypothetical protein
MKQGIDIIYKDKFLKKWIVSRPCTNGSKNVFYLTRIKITKGPWEESHFICDGFTFNWAKGSRIKILEFKEKDLNIYYCNYLKDKHLLKKIEPMFAKALLMQKDFN